MRLPVNRFVPLVALMFLAACGGGGSGPSRSLPPEPVNGPAADYPMVIGAPFVVDGKTFTPVDTMNYDTVGYAGIDAGGVTGISAAHRTLPLPSYVEVTALDSGKTVLVRLERRGPMTGSRLIDLSAGAAAQLGINGQEPIGVRVRRVNPPEVERAMLRAGQAAPMRMETPKSLLAVLARKLERPGALLTPPAIAPLGTEGATGTVPVPLKTAVTPALSKPDKPKPKPAAVIKPAPVTMPTPEPASPPPLKPKLVVPASSLIVQVAAFSTRERAAAVSARLGGQLSQSGRLWRVRMGPFTDQTDAATALAKAKSAGYSDARIQRTD
jgi:rare lipoprotein A